MPRIPFRLAAAGLTAAAAATGAAAQAPLPSAADALARAPVMAGVQVTTPAGAAGCRVEAVNYPKPSAATGYRVVDSQGKLVRQFIDTAGAGRPNMVYFYRDGAEAYREYDTNGNGKPDQFRWLGVNGGKWGEDKDEDGVVDLWYSLSPAELSQELFAALQAKDAKRLSALVVTEADLKAIKLPAAEAQKLLAVAAAAPKKFADAAAALNLAPGARWVHAEVGVPHVTPADSLGAAADLVKLPAVTVLYEKGDNKTADVLNTGELVQVGPVWKVIDGPAAGAVQQTGPVGVGVPDAVKKDAEDLGKLTPPANPADMPKYHAARAAILERVVAGTAGEQQLPWLQQLVDALTALSTDGPALDRLKARSAAIDPKSPVAGYAAYRVIDAEYRIRLSAAPDKAPDTLKWLREQLEAHVGKYPTAEDTPDAMMQLAVAHEFAGPASEAQAKTWYEKLAAALPADPRGQKAAGAVKRLQSEGQALTLPAATTTDGKPFDPASLAGKPVVVYYFANWSPDPAAEARIVDELKKLGDAVKASAAKGLTVVTISLDETPARAASAVTAAGLTGVHLYAPGGLDRSPLAMAYGIQTVPHLFLVGKDGKVVNRNAQAGPGLAAEVEKLLK